MYMGSWGRGLTLLAFGAAEAQTGYDARLVLVRPDQYVVWCGEIAPENPASILAKAVGASSMHLSERDACSIQT